MATRIQDLVAARLGRGFVPLALLFLVGVGEALMGRVTSETLILLVGAPAASGAMLAYGLRVVQRAFGRRSRAWMAVAVWGSLVPLAFSLYVLGWRGLRPLAGGTLSSFAVGLVFAVMGTWVMRAWMKIVEVERLARIMSFGLDEEVGTA